MFDAEQTDYKGRSRFIIAPVVVSPNTSDGSTPPIIRTEELQNAGSSRECQEALLRSAIHTFVHQRLGLLASLIRKQRPYSPEGFDGMVVVTPIDAGECDAIQHIGQLAVPELSTILDDCAMVLRAHAACATEAGISLGQQTIGFNCHIDAMDPAELDIEVKLHAQTISSLHLHTTPWTEDETERVAQKVALDRMVRDNLRDPLVPLIQQILSTDYAQQLLLSESIDLSLVEVRNGSLVLQTRGALDAHALAHDLLQLHHGAQTLYEQLSARVIHSDQTDELGFPLVRADHPAGEEDETIFDSSHGERGSVERHLRRLRTVLQPGPTAVEERNRLFLRGLAYTISIVHKPDQPNWQIIFTPHVISTGNMVDALGIVRLIEEGGDPTEWIEQKNLHDDLVENYLASIT